MTKQSRAEFAALVRSDPVDVGRACLLIGAEVEPDLDVGASLAVLDALASTVRPGGSSPAAQAAALQVALGKEAGFGGSPQDYEDLRSSLLHEVLRRGRGLPILLSVVWCEVAARAGIDAAPLGTPGHVLVCVGDADGDHVVVDPFGGGRVTDVAAEPPLPPVDLLLRVLTNIRVLTGRQARSLESARTRLWATELSLLLPRHPLALRRERGELLVRLGDYEQGAVELETFADAVEEVDGDAAATCRRQARLSRSRLN